MPPPTILNNIYTPVYIIIKLVVIQHKQSKIFPEIAALNPHRGPRGGEGQFVHRAYMHMEDP